MARKKTGGSSKNDAAIVFPETGVSCIKTKNDKVLCLAVKAEED